MSALEECDEYVPTCDAGDCDLPSAAVVWTGEEWLSCCRQHAQEELRVAGAEPCPECEAGNCRDCNDLTWDRDADCYTDCPCAGAGHG